MGGVNILIVKTVTNLLMLRHRNSKKVRRSLHIMGRMCLESKCNRQSMAEEITKLPLSGSIIRASLQQIHLR